MKTKTKCILKKIGVLSPLVLAAVSTIVGLSTAIGFAVVDNNVKKDIKNHAIVQEIKDKDLEILNSQYEEGKITASEFSERKEFLGSKEYIEEIVELPELAEQKELIKNKTESLRIASIAGVCVAIASIGGSLCFIKPLSEIYDSADLDLIIAEKEETSSLEIPI